MENSFVAVPVSNPISDHVVLDDLSPWSNHTGAVLPSSDAPVYHRSLEQCSIAHRHDVHRHGVSPEPPSLNFLTESLWIRALTLCR